MTCTPNYIEAKDYARFGLPVDTTDDQVSEASGVIDAYLKRPEGLLWEADADGNPLYMVRKPPEGSRKLVAPITAGTSVPVILTGGPLLTVGDVFILNKALENAHVVEACVVESIQDKTHVTLESVSGAHSANETVDTGLVIEQIERPPKDRAIARLSRTNITRLFSSMGRLVPSRRGDRNNYAATSLALLGGAPVWQKMTITDSDIDRASGQIWCPVGILMTPYNEMKFNYVAGFSQKGLPDAIRHATANVVKAIAESPASANIKFFRAGETQMTRFLDTVIDGDTRNLLIPHIAKTYG